MLRATLTIALIVVPLIQGTSLQAQGQESPPPEDVERIIEEILQLRGEAEALLESLSPELREEVERRWQELQAEPSEAPIEDVARPKPIDAIRPAPEVAEEAPVSEPVESTAEPGVMPEAEPELQLETEAEPVAPSESESEPEPEIDPEAVAAKECDSLGPLDTNGDGVISASDRNWRYLRLRTGITGKPGSSGDLESLYDLEIREIDVNLRFYKSADGLSGDITVDDRIRLHLFGRRKSDRRSAILVIQASRLARGGGLRLVDGSGTLLAGAQPLAPGMALQTAEGKRLPILCP